MATGDPKNPAEAPTTETTIRLGTRGSKLAMWQSNWVKSELEKKWYES